MTRLVWGEVGQRYYEAGVDRGVLYVDGEGYAWNGLVSVDESPSGGEARAYYIDGVKYLNIASKEEFEATLDAIYSPPQFDACDGVGQLRPGLFATQQRRKEFGLSYRTGIGSDTDPNRGYKIHIVYNALAAPSSRSRKSLNDSPEVEPLSWSITTKPVMIPEMGRSAHLMVDTTTAPAYAVEQLELMLYGSEMSDPRLPDPDEVVGLFTDPSPFMVTDLGNGLFELSGSGLAVNPLGNSMYEITAETITAIDANTAQISS